MSVGYLSFELDVRASDGRKTDVIGVYSVRSGELLGRIKWFGNWRQYTFFPQPDTIWNPDCLDAVNTKIRELMALREGKP